MINPDVTAAIREFLESNWTACPLAWENEAFNEPDPPVPWALIRLTGQSEQASLGDPGNNLWRDYGRLMISVSAPRGSGAAPAQGLLYSLCRLFRERTLIGDALTFEDVLAGSTKDATDAHPWWGASASIAWQYDNQ